MKYRKVTIAVLVGAMLVSGPNAFAEYVAFFGRLKHFERHDPLPVYGEFWIPKSICSDDIDFKLEDSDGERFRLRSKSATSGRWSKSLGDVPQEAAFGPAKIIGKQKCGNPPLGVEAGDKINIIIGNPSAPPPEINSATASNVVAGNKAELRLRWTQLDYSVSYLNVTVQQEFVPDVWVDVDVVVRDKSVVKGATKRIEWSTRGSDLPGHYRFLVEFWHGQPWERSDKTVPEEMATAGFYLGDAFGSDLVDPTDGAIDNDGNLVVADTVHDQLEIFSPDGRKLEETAEIYNEPKDVAFDDAGRTYVAEFGTQNVAFTEGSAITRIDHANWSGGRCSPVGIDVVPDGSRIWVADSCSILALNRSGQELLEIREGIDDVDDVALAPDGSVWAADFGAGNLLHYSATGTLLQTVTQPNVTPRTVDVDASGRLWVGVRAEIAQLDIEYDDVYLLDPTGTLIASIGRGLIDEATGIAVGGRAGNVYVIDRGEWQIVHMRHPI